MFLEIWNLQRSFEIQPVKIWTLSKDVFVPFYLNTRSIPFQSSRFFQGKDLIEDTSLNCLECCYDTQNFVWGKVVFVWGLCVGSVNGTVPGFAKLSIHINEGHFKFTPQKIQTVSYRVSKNVLYPKMQNFKNFYYNKDNRIWYFGLFRW